MPKINIFIRFILLILCAIPNSLVFAQYDVHYDNNYPATLIYGPEQQNGFRISVSLVAMFSAGITDRNGFRWGAGVTLSEKINDWVIVTGLDVYKAKQKFGVGIAYAGAIYDDGEYGASYYASKYFQDAQQFSGVVRLHLDNVRINFEDDILAFPFTGFKVYDRYRTAALEIQYKEFLIGTNVYTTESNGLTDMSCDNSKGIYHTGKQISSPIFVGYTNYDVILRCGINDKMGGLFGQNAWHRYLFRSADFSTGTYNDLFLQLGLNKPYTLY